MKSTCFLSAALASLFAANSAAQTPNSQRIPDDVGFTVVNTNIPGRWPATDGHLIAFQMNEGAGGDLNGDGVVTPALWVIQYYNIATKMLVNTQQEGQYPSVSKGKIAFERWEQNGGINTDWNADGDFQDHLIAYYMTGMGAPVDTLIDGRDPDIHKGKIAFHTWESSVGQLPGTDLNGDGDTTDPVVQYFVIPTAGLFNTSAAGTEVSISGDTIVFSTWEAHCWNGAGATEPGVPNPPDLNGDGDLTDYILRYHTISTGVNTFTGVDCVRPTVDGSLVACAFDENQTVPDPPVDADFDVDTVDLVLQWYDLTTGMLTNAMFPVHSTPTMAGRFAAFDLEEIFLGYSMPPAQGTELSGNGLPGDFVVCFYDTTTGAFTATGVTGFSLSGDCMADRFIVFSSQNGGLIGYIELE